MEKDRSLEGSGEKETGNGVKSEKDNRNEPTYCLASVSSFPSLGLGLKMANPRGPRSSATRIAFFICFTIVLIAAGVSTANADSLGDAPRLSPPKGSPGSVAAPGSGSGRAAPVGLSKVNATALWNRLYVTNVNITGNINAYIAGTCNAGWTTDVFKNAVLRRINYFREAAGIPALTGFVRDQNMKCQRAATLMSVNRALNHEPPTTGWFCTRMPGAIEAAGNSNLYLGRNGPAAVTGYIEDPGSGNTALGHRRWILHPPTRTMATGDVPGGKGFQSANALWVFDAYTWYPSKMRDGFVAWPPPGFVPRQVVFPRWSFGLPNAVLTNARVNVLRNGVRISVTRYTPDADYGLPTLAWELAPAALPSPSGETKYSVVVTGVILGGATRSFTYTVTAFVVSK